MVNLNLMNVWHRFKSSIENGLLKIMSKMGISVISSYRGGCNFETVGLSRAISIRLFSRNDIKNIWHWINWYRKKN